ncbi:unnamed protein product [Dibothriocephalus latus]|uniref:Uncharacterized protein n=1 Tax=Dibothriocephalus latus TaxID=60516 RepID=A0A3P7RE58_DIBLA|nr:unnamed protein product [Dibothriocephalus latus]
MSVDSDVTVEEKEKEEVALPDVAATTTSVTELENSATSAHMSVDSPVTEEEEKPKEVTASSVDELGVSGKCLCRFWKC